MKLFLYQFIFGISVTFLTTGVSADKRNIHYQCQIFRLIGEFEKNTSLSRTIWAGTPEVWKGMEDEILLFDSGEFKIDDNILSIGRKGCYWNDFKLTFEEGFQAKLPNDRIKMIHSPNIHHMEGDPVRMTVASRQPFQYMIPNGALFELKEISLPVGMDINIKANKKGQDNYLITELDLELRTVKKRTKVKGTTLPVGMPELDIAKYELTLNVRNHKNYGILIRPKSMQGAIIVRIEIEEQ